MHVSNKKLLKTHKICRWFSWILNARRLSKVIMRCPSPSHARPTWHDSKTSSREYPSQEWQTDIFFFLSLTSPLESLCSSPWDFCLKVWPSCPPPHSPISPCPLLLEVHLQIQSHWLLLVEDSKVVITARMLSLDTGTIQPWISLQDSLVALINRATSSIFSSTVLHSYAPGRKL